MTRKPLKTIHAVLPKGFKLIVSETTLPENILCLENAKKQRLYIRIASPRELLKPQPQWIFEILSIEDMQKHGLKIEESYNQELTNKPYIIEESANGEENDDFEEGLPPEALEAIKKHKQKQSQVVINIHGKGSNEGENADEWIKEFGSHVVERVTTKAIDLGIPIDVKNEAEFQALAKAVMKAEKSQKSEAENKADPHGQAGTAPLTHAQDSRLGINEPVKSPEELKKKLLEMAFDSSKDMVDTLHSIEHLGTEKEKKVAEDLLTKLLLKSMKIRQNPQFRGFSYEGKKTPKDILEELSDEIRQKRKVQRGD